ncbi:methylmalonyl Co-A mutase-associated GTPase MeaB [Dyadobacter sp. CY312]|uniref:methylmalonyl Co-A mutase-associated GTPase MeaB n=1 Tax=Dyadobacter sp. CY312 TaxID=2907303 RepID=UPI001F2F58F6|nr:methylmalonyl Co-A mutase-associated GTPase MeaB [Dyadobacter sp. CY312]MCE7042220.1 methylmalonyl Co-A mutase-associated GTPase MeaB [Dyadobacter sp. CY312]
MRQRLSPDEYSNGILTGDRIILSRAITIIESQLREDRELSRIILNNILPETGKSLRIGITGVPGVGKSTFIETLGTYITGKGKKLAVLTIDPSSKKTGGSILGDKTRMEKLSHNPKAFIRPSASNLSLGGVAQNTREAMLLCEAAGFDVIIIETVGVGQSETIVKGMTDFFLLLMLAGAGDELQGIKKGIMEMADTIAINKADGTNKAMADRAVQEYSNALHLFSKPESGFTPKVVPCSAIANTGIDVIWRIILSHREHSLGNGFFHKNRQSQNIEWMYDSIKQTLQNRFFESDAVARNIAEVEKSVSDGKELPLHAAERLLNIFLHEEEE